MNSTGRAIFIAVMAVAASLTGACEYGKQAETPGAVSIKAPESRLPFQAREPDVYSAEIVVSAGDTERVTRIARSGAYTRTDYDPGEPSHLAVIHAEKSIYLAPAAKLYAEKDAAAASGLDPWSEDIRKAWLFEAPNAEFVELETEDGVTKYSARIGGGPTEIFVFVDNEIGMPVRQEIYGAVGGSSVMQYSAEMRNFRPEAADELFMIPQGYRKVPHSELLRIVNRSGVSR